MCVVSYVSDYGNTFPDSYWLKNPSYWDHFKKLLEDARKFDEETGQKECVDPKKQEWMDNIEKKLANLEKEIKVLKRKSKKKKLPFKKTS